ncbi:MAG: M20/M25/M40 family metallo-hydrolase [Gemmatimonadales bacterium]|nr:MAG: M20/M25/M40 family metallo-hydrolase [Gemmatimonadales bacterium]
MVSLHSLRIRALSTSLAPRLLEGDVVSLTEALVRLPTVNPALEAGGGGEAPAASLCGDLLSTWGFGVETHEWAPGRTSLVARIGGEGPSLILNGHLDTVGVEGMTVSPFEPSIREGRLYGRGSCDMKGGVAALLCAARDMALQGRPRRGELLVVLTSDEEHASRGLEALLAEGLRADAAVVCEPTSLQVMPANKGFAWWRVEFRGRAAHGSRPDQGCDAIRLAGRFLAALDGVEDRLASAVTHPLLGSGSIHAGTIRGGTAPSVYPDRCELVLEARLLPGQRPEEMGEWLAALGEEVTRVDPRGEVTVIPTLRRPPGDLPGTHPLPRALQAAGQAMGRPMGLAGMSAWVEAAWFLEAGIPALCFGPGSIGKAHTADEFVPVEELRAAASILSRFTRSFLSNGV